MTDAAFAGLECIFNKPHQPDSREVLKLYKAEEYITAVHAIQNKIACTINNHNYMKFGYIPGLINVASQMNNGKQIPVNKRCNQARTQKLAFISLKLHTRLTLGHDIRPDASVEFMFTNGKLPNHSQKNKILEHLRTSNQLFLHPYIPIKRSLCS
jgi:hypothetical protein